MAGPAGGDPRGHQRDGEGGGRERLGFLTWRQRDGLIRVRRNAGMLGTSEAAVLSSLCALVPAQVKLLRALQEDRVQKVGSSRPQKVDVRVIAAVPRQGKWECGKAS